MAGSHARDLEWHVGENSRKKAMCVTAAWAGGLRVDIYCILGVFAKTSTKTSRGVTVNEYCSVLCYCKGGKTDVALPAPQ